MVLMVELAVGDPATVVSEKKRAPRTKFEIPDGWIARGFTFEVAWPDDLESVSSIRSQFDGRRFAYNWALAQVKTDMDAKKIDPSHASVPWNLYAFRRRFNVGEAEHRRVVGGQLQEGVFYGDRRPVRRR